MRLSRSLLNFPAKRYLNQQMWRRSFATAVKAPPKRRVPGARTGLVLVTAVGGLVLYDTQFNSSAFTRTARSIGVLATIALDYKINFNEHTDIGQLHLRNADRLFNLLITNKGLYIKIGQALALQATMFPPVFQEKFAKLFDNAPQDTKAQIQKTFHEEFNVGTEDIFSSFDLECIASASIAQVHKAQLKTGEWVAVKIQHSEIQRQIYWDLATYKLVMKCYGWFFDLPLGEISAFIASRMETETNFYTEQKNAETTKSFLEKDYSLRGHVYIPKSYPEFSTKRVLVCEWIDGIPLAKIEELKREGYDTTGALNKIMLFFSKQIFEWGCIHCDPHPGNLMLRRHNGKEQVVVIDHGLYAYETPEFRAQNSRLWRSMFILDHQAVRDVITGWGIGTVDMFASMTMMRPYKSKQVQVQSDYEMQKSMVRIFQTMIKDIDKMPLVLILVGRANTILQGCNRMYGSPVNRIKIMAYQASKSFSDLDATADQNRTWIVRKVLALVNHAKFQFAVLVMDAAFHLVRIRQFFSSSDSTELGMEAVIERQMMNNANSMGLKMKPGVMFSG